MGRNVVRLDENRTIAFGYDRPTNGYFAELYDTNSKQYKLDGGCSDSAGKFFEGVNKNRVISFLETYHAIDLAKAQRPEAYGKLLLDLPC